MTFSSDYFRALVGGQARGWWPSLQRGGLLVASVPYGWAVGARNWLYTHQWKRRYLADVPVISVGNLTLGGTGKTPCVEYVARFYRQRDVRVAILSRGYGSVRGRNDEALVLEENLPDVPHLQGPDRVVLAKTAREELESEALILDDGFQHRRLARDLDVVLLDATNPWGHGYLFPRGLLREPARSLRRAGVIALTRCDQVQPAARRALREAVERTAPDIPVVETIHRPVALVSSERQEAPFEDLGKHPVAAFCGLGNPEAFRQTLVRCGADVQAFRVFADHHAYMRTDVESLRTWAGQQATDCVIVTTQKDLVKLRLAMLGGRPLWALQISLHVEVGQELLDRKLEEALSTRRADRG